nr:ankyrin repeat-containing protein NPR4-like isoform X3 [Ipomoea batatas]
MHAVDDLEAGNYVAEQDYSSNYLTLHRATVHGKWEEAQKFLEDNNHAIQAPIGIHKNTALHDAAKAGHKDFMEKAVEMMGDNNTNSKEVGVVKNRDGLTALHIAAQFGNKEVGEILVGKNPNLLYQRCNRGLLPIHYAAFNTRRSPEVFRYFRGVTKEDPKVDPYAGPTGATILVNLIKSKFYVVAMDLANEYPNLARHRTLDNETSPLEAIVKYDYPIIKDKEALMLVECLCDKLKTLNGTQVASLAKEAIIHAAYLDIEEVVKNIVEAYPIAAYYKDKSGRNILHIAIENRSTNVFNFVRENSMLMHDLVDERDNDGNNIAHFGWEIDTYTRTQCECRSFKCNRSCNGLRNKDEKTPKMVFRDEHKELRKEGEKWMKDTATACSIVATLIVTVVFAAAITVPGGNSDGVLIQGFNATINNNASINGTIIGPIDETPPKEGLPVFSKRHDAVNGEDFSIYLPLYKASVQGDWGKAETFLGQHNNAIQAPLNSESETALHVAAKAGHASFAERLVARLPADAALDLKARKEGLTPLHLAALYGNIEVAEILLLRDPSLISRQSNEYLLPIHYAASNTRNSNRVFLNFFHLHTRDSPLTQDDHLPTLLVYLIRSKFYGKPAHLASIPLL